MPASPLGKTGCAIPSLLVLTGFVLLGSAGVLGANLFTASIVAAAVPLPLYLAAALWLDRFEPEPRGLLFIAFLWGASVAILVSGILNGIADSAIGQEMSAIVAAPLGEEICKALVLFYLFARRKDEFDGVVDGVVYAAMVGLGFAFAENIDYYGRALKNEGTEGLAVTVTLRGVISPYSHPLFTGMTGVGLGLARETKRAWVRWAAPGAGLCTAILLHSLWNAGALSGCVFFLVYGFIMVPALAVLIGLVARALRREGRLVREHLLPEVVQGLISDGLYAEVSSVRRRARGAIRAFFHGGPRAWREMRRTYHAAAELALLRNRVSRGIQPPDPDLEVGYLRALIPGYAPAPPPAPPPLPSPDEPPPPSPGA